MNSLTTIESSSLAELETVIDAGLRTFKDVGLALLQIRDQRLYRQTHGTFEEYCRQKWSWTARYSNQLIHSASVVRDLGTIVPKPINEAQARALASVAPEKRAGVLQKALGIAESKRRALTARDVKEAAQPSERPTKDAIETPDSAGLKAVKHWWRQLKSAERKRFILWLESKRHLKNAMKRTKRPKTTTREAA